MIIAFPSYALELTRLDNEFLLIVHTPDNIFKVNKSQTFSVWIVFLDFVGQDLGGRST